MSLILGSWVLALFSSLRKQTAFDCNSDSRCPRINIQLDVDTVEVGLNCATCNAQTSANFFTAFSRCDSG